MVYANARAFRYRFPIEFWQEVAVQAPTIVAAKYSRPKNLTELISVTRGRINFVPNEMTAATFYAASPETTTGCWATAAGMGPAPAIALMRAIQARESASVERIDRELAWANEPLKPIIGDPEIFASYNIQIEKARINAAGYSQCGPCRPPYNHIPSDYLAAAAECGKRWRSLQQQYQAGHTAQPAAAG